MRRTVITFFLLVAVAGWLGQSSKSGLEPSLSVEAVAWLDDLQEAFEQAKQLDKPLVIEFSADWCEPCLRMDRETFIDSDVVDVSERFVMLEVDTTSRSAEAMELVKEYKVEVLPTFLVLNSDGSLKPGSKRTGFMNAREFAGYLQGIYPSP